MTPRELKSRLDRNDPVQIVDVREPVEWQISNIGGKLIPLRELPSRMGELDPTAETVVLCHHGIRSAQAVLFLRERGFGRVHNLHGGIEAWSLTVDSRVNRY